MDFTKAINMALDNKSLLFLGAGYSLGATAINGKNLLTAPQLAEKLCELAHITKTTNLMDAADDYIDEVADIDQVIETLSKYLKAKKVEPYHQKIAQIPWRCVFTTNYDNVYELACLNESKNYKIATMSDSIQAIGAKENLVVHLNGMIERLDRNTIQTEFKLSNSSYLTSEFINSLWYEKFIREAEISKSIFFIGYSLYDIDIKRILNAHPTLKEKTFFILPNFATEREKKIACKFGTLIEKTTEEFSQTLTKSQERFIPTTKEPLLTSFELTNDRTYSTTPIRIHYDDVFELFFLGNYDKNKIYQSLLSESKDRYYIKRKELLDIFSIIKDGSCKNILIQSDFGNGKTLLIEGLKALCAKNGLPCYQLIEHSNSSVAELDYILKKTNKQILIIEDYNRYTHLLKQISISRPDNLILILSERTAINDIFIDRLSKNLSITEQQEDLRIFNINILDDESITELVETFNDYGLWQDFSNENFYTKIKTISINCKGAFAHTLLKAIKSSDIEKRLRNIYDELKDNSAYRDIVTTICIFSSISYNIDVQTVLNILDNPIRNSVTFETNPAVREIFNTNTYQISLKSSILAKHIISTFLNANHVVSILIKTYEYCNKRNQGHNNKYFLVMRELDKFSNIQDLLPREQRLQSSADYFDGIGALNNNSSNYHYWLQYAISKTVYEDFPQAKTMFNSAYSLYRKKNTKTRNNMLDNHYARFLLLRAIKTDNHSSYTIFKKANTIVQRQIHLVKETEHFPYRCTILYPDYFRKEISNLTEDNILHFMVQLRQILKQIKKIPSPLQYNRNVSISRTNLTKLLHTIESSLEQI
ncbi:SIR2 family protein [Maridesulfovibrio sp.]|uniref:SIR2 family protein n=1 Tax=Maridesulfovibrio sp. TaxID=2795000 RepID=UPI0029F5BFB8|nr:SIR2 family protein [Maridesulfovibrio sp.]